MAAAANIGDAFDSDRKLLSDGLVQSLTSPHANPEQEAIERPQYGRDSENTPFRISVRNRVVELGDARKRDRQAGFGAGKVSQLPVTQATFPRRRNHVLQTYSHRLNELEEYARADGYSLNIGSKATFARFMEKLSSVRQPRLILMENGNLRAMWKCQKDFQMGLQFLDNNEVQFVIFRPRADSNEISRAYGRDSLEGIAKLITAFDLKELVIQ